MKPKQNIFILYSLNFKLTLTIKENGGEGNVFIFVLLYLTHLLTHQRFLTHNELYFSVIRLLKLANICYLSFHQILFNYMWPKSFCYFLHFSSVSNVQYTYKRRAYPLKYSCYYYSIWWKSWEKTGKRNSELETRTIYLCLHTHQHKLNNGTIRFFICSFAFFLY